MNTTSTGLFADPNEYVAANDSQAIQAAIDAARREQINRVVIPRNNLRTGQEGWHLAEPVRLPENFTVVLNNCQITAAGSAFINSNHDLDQHGLGSEQAHIVIIGIGSSALRGDDPDAALISLRNVRYFRLDGLNFHGPTDGIRLAYARDGRVLRCRYRDMAGGLTLSASCQNLIIENQVGSCANHLISLRSWDDPERTVGKSNDIYGIIIARVRGDSARELIKVTAGDSTSVYNLVIRDTICESESTDNWAIRLGTEGGGCLRDITVRGLSAAAGNGVCVAASLFHCFFSGISVPAERSEISAEDASYLFTSIVERGSDAPLAQAVADSPHTLAERFLNPNDPRFRGDSDARTIQNAVDAAASEGVGVVVIPRYNARTGRALWEIDTTILLPSNMTVILQNCHMCLADWCYCNMFSNREAFTEAGTLLSERQRNITITGFGDAVLDGGRHNGILEKTIGKYGLPSSMMPNAMIYFHNCENVRVENFFMLQQRWYGVNFMYCSDSYVGNLDFYARELVPNLDGVDLRTGCNNFLIENIMGTLSDDVVAMNLLGYGGQWQVKGLPTHTHDNYVRNVIADACRWNIVRLLNHDRNRIYNITLDTIVDASLTEYKKRPAAAVRIGSNDYAAFEIAQMGDMDSITILDLYSRAARAIDFSGRSSNVKISNIHVFSDGMDGISTYDSAELEHIHIKNVFYGKSQRSLFLGLNTLGGGEQYDPAKYTGTALFLNQYKGRDILLENIVVDRVGEVVRLTGGATVEIKNLTVNEYGKVYALCDTKSSLTINGVPIARTEYIRLE